jgi:DNA-binding PadR family transcriptional regulator
MDLKLTTDEANLLRDLEKREGEARISGNNSHAGLKRLVEHFLVTAQHDRTAPDTIHYTLTENGREWLKKNPPA